MTIPSGSGSEVLKRAYTDNLSNGVVVLLDGVADHIYTILSITFCEVATADELLYLRVNIDGGGTQINLLSNHSLPAGSTFVWSDKFIITGTDEINAYLATTGSVDVYVTYIDQDWT
jgi:hypothetical protein